MSAVPVHGKRVSILGAARSGVAAAELLGRSGAVVLVSDQGVIDEQTTLRLERIDVRVESGGHSASVLDADLIVVSPGVPSTAEPVRRAVAAGIPVYSEIEIASWFCEAPIIAVTGSNGKTTTATLIAHVAGRSGRRTVLAGNIGLPFSSVVGDLEPGDLVVLEVSSFQLDHVDRFAPQVGVVLNVTPDHLDRYADFEAYVASKMRIGARQTSTDFFIYGLDDQVVREAVASNKWPLAARRLAFSTETAIEQGAFVRETELIVRLNSQEDILMQADQLALKGRHNLRNALAAALASRVMEIRSDVIRESLMGFEGIAHRMEFVREVDGVRYVNDSKATNVNAVWYALESFNQPVVLIAGGRDKGNDYSELAPLVRRRARALIAIGESGDKVMRDLGSGLEEARRVFTMAEAVELAHEVARSGDVVLLSPACASFDMFENYEDRGETFKRLVREL